MTLQLTRAGKQKLVDELAHLSADRRHDLAMRVQEANEDGGTSDSNNYELLKQELVLLDARIQELQFMLEHSDIIEHPSVDKVGLGSTVTLLGEDGAEETWTVVDQAEADARSGSISTDSPVGQAILGKQPGDAAEVETPGGKFRYKIVSIS